MGDGCVYKSEKHGHYVILLCQTRKEFATSFESALREIGLHPHTYPVHQTTTWGEYSGYRTQAYSKPFVEWYKSLSLEKIEEMGASSKENMKEFIRGFYESEGSSRLYKRRRVWNISFSNKNRGLLEMVQRILGRLGFTFYMYSDKRKDAFELTNGKHSQNRRFIEEIKPCIKTRVLEPPHRKWSKEKVVEELIRVTKEIGRSPRTKEVQPSLWLMAQRFFGTWNEAKRSANLKTYPRGFQAGNLGYHLRGTLMRRNVI